MITAVHTLVYSDDPAATRAFLRDIVGLAWVADDDSSEPGAAAGSEQSWLIFDTGASELAVHPTDFALSDGIERAPRHHQLSFMVSDVAAAEAELRAKGAEIVSGPTEFSWGTGVEVAVPGTDPILFYQASHATIAGSR